MCSGSFASTNGGPGEAAPDVGGEGQGLNEPVRGTSAVEETEGREGRTRND